MLGYLPDNLGRFQNPVREDKGQGLAEYGLLAALIAVACAIVIGLFGEALRDQLNRIVETFPSVGS